MTFVSSVSNLTITRKYSQNKCYSECYIHPTKNDHACTPAGNLYNIKQQKIQHKQHFKLLIVRKRLFYC